jgi:hypothetical protein
MGSDDMPKTSDVADQLYWVAIEVKKSTDRLEVQLKRIADALENEEKLKAIKSVLEK